jgi:DNA-binding transcriptional LysR family regulator
MDWRRLDLNLLKVLGCMLEERSVVRTAERLCISPSAVSHALARLRRAFGDPLFVRAGTFMVPTARAAALERSLAMFTATLDLQLDETRSEDTTFDPSRSKRSFKLVAPGALELSIIPQIVREIRRTAPHMSIAVEPFERRSYEPDLVSGRVDFVFAIGGYTHSTADLDSAIVRRDELVVLAGPKSHLFEGPDTIDVDTYLGQPQVYPLPWPAMQNYLDTVLARSGQRRTFALSLTSYAAVGEVLASTDLIASLPDHTAAVIVRSYPVLRRFRMIPERRSDLSLHWSKTALREPAVRWLRDQIERSAAQEAW